MKNKKLLIFSYDYIPSNGGIARLCSEITNGAAEKYEEVVVLTKKKNGPQSIKQHSNVSVVYAPNKRILSELWALFFLLRLKNRKRYQILCGIWHPEALLVWLAGFRNINVLTHGAELLSGNSKFRKNFWLSIYAKWILNKTNIIANSDYTGGLSKSLASKARVKVLPLAVNHLFFKPLKRNLNNKVVFGTVSRVMQFKGHDFILKVINELPKEYKNSIEWHIAGTGPYLNQLKKDVVVLELEKNVKFHGFVPNEKLPDFYNSLDVFLLCTRQTLRSNNVEGFGLVFLEAQACGIPVIGTNTGGISSAIKQNEGGWLIEQDDKKVLTNLIKKIIDNLSLFQEQGLRARKRVEISCTWNLYCEQLFKTLQ